MPFLAKLAIFWVIVGAGLWLLRRFPGSVASRLALSWHGPIPVLGERKSHFFFRWCRYGCGWFTAFLLLFAACGLLMAQFPRLSDSPTFLAMLFACGLLAGMAGLGACLAAVVALKAQMLGPNPVAQEQEEALG